MYNVFVTEGDGLPYEESFSELFAIVDDDDEADIICLSGGEDIYPGVYGAIEEGAKGFNVYRDIYEWHLIHKWAGKKPLVGICRGFQLLSVLSGLKLFQHHATHAMMHKHELSTGHTVPSSHHQCVHNNNMTPPGCDIVTVKGSASIESVYWPDQGWCGVQWHPYACDDDEFGFTFFNQIVQALAQEMV